MESVHFCQQLVNGRRRRRVQLGKVFIEFAFLSTLFHLRLPFHKYANLGRNVVFLAYKIYKLHEKKLYNEKSRVYIGRTFEKQENFLCLYTSVDNII